MDVIYQILTDMWANITSWNGGFIALFLGAGAVLVSVIMGIIYAFSD